MSVSKIVSYTLCSSLESAGCTEALNMALPNRLFRDKTLIRQSHRGVQCCSGNYVDFLKITSSQSNLTQNESLYENALAEHMDVITKPGFIPRKCFQNHHEAKETIKRIAVTFDQQLP